MLPSDSLKGEPLPLFEAWDSPLGVGISGGGEGQNNF